MAPNTVAEQVQVMTGFLGCDKSELFARLIEEEFQRSPSMVTFNAIREAGNDPASHHTTV